LGIHKKISASLNNLSGEDRARELEARLTAHRKVRPSQEERQKSLDSSRLEDREEVYKGFIRDSLTTPKAVTKKAADRLNEIVGKVIITEETVRQAITTNTGVLSLDYFLGGGLPSGFTEIYGPESVGKTSLLAKIICAAQKMGKQVMMTSTEFFDGPYFEKNSVALDQLLMVRSGKGDKVLEAAYHLLRSVPNLIYVIDSATGLRPPNDEYDNWARMMLNWMDEISGIMDVGSCVIVVNQVRARKSIDPQKFFAGGTDSVARKIAGIFSTRLELSRTSVTESSYDMVVNVVANTLKAPAKVFTLPVVKGRGIDVERDLVRVAEAVGTIQRSGSWYWYDSIKIAQGEEEAAISLREVPSLYETVLNRTLRTLVRGGGP
jgi:recombination protein RecA